MRFYLDCEFFENGPYRPIRPISVALVSAAGSSLYVVNEDFFWPGASDWLKENVQPHLDAYPSKKMPEHLLGPAVQKFIQAHTGNSEPEFWGYYADYDWVVFCQLFGAMIHLPHGFPMYCNDLKQLAVSLGDPELPLQTGPEHNALADALWNKEVHQYLLQQLVGVACDSDKS